MNVIAVRELGLHIAVSGVRGVPADWLERLQRARGAAGASCLQLLGARGVADWRHVVVAVFNAHQALSNGYSRLQHLEAELLLVLAGVDRFQKAVETVGCTPARPAFAVAVALRKEEAEAALSLLMMEVGASEEDALLELDEGRAEDLSSTHGLAPRETDLTGKCLGSSLDGLRAELIERGALVYCH